VIASFETKDWGRKNPEGREVKAAFVNLQEEH
jgi:hypothetical protein